MVCCFGGYLPFLPAHRKKWISLAWYPNLLPDPLWNWIWYAAAWHETQKSRVEIGETVYQWIKQEE